MSDTSKSARAADLMSPDALFARLDALGIVHRTIRHAPVFTVDESKALRGSLEGGHSKNLFLRNKKGAMWLVTCLEDRRIDLNRLADALDAGRFSFATPERLERYLGVIPGAVTPFAVANDIGGAVSVVLDRALMEIDPLNFHPLDNAMTTAIAPQGLMRFLEAFDHRPQLLDFDSL